MQWDISSQVGKTILIRKRREVLSFQLERIRYIICDGHYCFIFMADGTDARIKRSLRYFRETEKLDETCGFLHINRNTLVNTRYFSNVHLSRNKRTFYLKNEKKGKDETHIVSKRKVELFK